MKYSKNKSNRFINKKVLITGAAGGIGKSLVKLFKEEGAIVAATDIKLSEMNVAAYFEGDLMNASFCDTLPKKVAEKIGGLDIVCNNAGVITRGKITKTTIFFFSQYFENCFISKILNFNIIFWIIFTIQPWSKNFLII